MLMPKPCSGDFKRIMRGYLIRIYIYFTYEFTFIEVLGDEVN